MKRKDKYKTKESYFKHVRKEPKKAPYNSYDLSRRRFKNE